MAGAVPASAEPALPEPPVGDPIAVPASRHDRHFATDHLMGDLKGRSVRGGAVTLTSQGIKFVLQLGSTMVLARLLTPGDFGLIAMVTAITGFVAMFKDAGLSMATVQRKDITHEQVSTLFWINVGLSALVMLVLAALAPAIAAFYSEPRLVWITLALAGTMLFGGLTVQHQALLRRQMRFKALAIVEVATMAFSIAVAIAMALLGFGYWSLVGMAAGAALANAVLVWALCDWKPGVPARHCGAASMLQFGGHLTGFTFLNYFTRHADNLIVGFVLGSGPLGIYSKAYNLLMLPIRQINTPVGSVMLPALSRLQDKPDRYCRAYTQAISAIAMVGMPIVVCAFVLADEAVAVLLGPGWEQAAVVFRWLAPAAFIGTVNVAPGWLCVSLGRAGTQLRWAMLSAPICIVAFMIGVQWGITGVAAAFSLSWCTTQIIFLAMACHNSPVSLRMVLASLFPPASASLLSGLAGFTIMHVALQSVQSAVIVISCAVPVLVSVYLTFLYLIPRSRRQITTFFRDGVRSILTDA